MAPVTLLDSVKLVVGDKVPGDAGNRWLSILRNQISTVHRLLLPQCVLGDTSFQGESSGQGAKGDPAYKKVNAVVEGLRSVKLKEAARKVVDGIVEALTYCDFPNKHRIHIRTNNVIERLNETAENSV